MQVETFFTNKTKSNGKKIAKIKRNFTPLALQQYGQQTVGKELMNRSKQNNTGLSFEKNTFEFRRKKNRWP